jgi:predicted nucleotidyltransferase
MCEGFIPEAVIYSRVQIGHDCFIKVAPAAPMRFAYARMSAKAGMRHNIAVVTLETLPAEKREEILRLAGRRGAHNLRVFGSAARGEANENGDLDLLVTWEPGRSLLDHAGLVQDLQELMGVPVHVGTEQSLHWYVRDKILREATPL